MGRFARIALLSLSVAMLATGCDFFRSLAGRPTSKDIASMKAEIQRRQADSLERAAALKQAQEPVGTEVAEEPAPASDAKPGKRRFYVIMGAFSNKDNADKCAARLKDLGYEPEFFGFTEGRTAVGIGGTDDESEAKAFMTEVKRQDFCPEGVWILDRKRK
ncbi:MAG: SPOR domain-containing protein [Bacteroidales bacterium]|nr:SPOR domain-containing protein [Bacteroidales bacterium]